MLAATLISRCSLTEQVVNQFVMRKLVSLFLPFGGLTS